MRYILSILILLCSVTAFGQVPEQFLGSPGNRIVVRGQLKIDSSLIVPIRLDTLFIPGTANALVYNSSDKRIYYYNGLRWYGVMYGDSLIYATAFGVDTAKSNIRSEIALSLDSIVIYTASGTNPDTLYSYKDGDSVLVGYIPKFTGITTDATLTGNGLSGNPLKADTIVLSTRQWRQKGIDSLNSVLRQTIADSAATKLDSIHVYAASDPDPDTLYSYKNGDSVFIGLIQKPGISTTWGTIGGTLSDQTDLQSALDTKLDSLHIYTASDPDPDTIYQYKSGDSSLVGYIPKGGALEAVTTDATLTGDGTSGDPLKVDTLLISTRAWRQKGDDSVAVVLRKVIIDSANAKPDTSQVIYAQRATLQEKPAWFDWLKLSEPAEAPPVLQDYGSILSTDFDFAAFPSNITEVTPNTAITFNQPGLTAVGGSASFNNYIEDETVLGQEKWIDTLTFIPREFGNGIAVAKQAQIGGASIFAFVNLTNTSARGQIQLYSSPGASFHASSLPHLTVNLNDTMQLILQRSGNTITYRLLNLTTDLEKTGTYTYSTSSATTTPLIPALSKSRVYFLGGTQDVLYWSSSGKAKIGKHVVVVGNSITVGYSSIDFNNRWVNQLFSYDTSKYEVCAGQGERSAEAVTKIEEVKRLAPKYVLYNMGVNDARTGVSATTFKANVLTFVDSMLANSITPILVNLTPQNSVDVRPWNDSLESVATLRGLRYIDIFTPLTGGGGTVMSNEYNSDGIHPNERGHVLIAETIAAQVADLIFDTTNFRLTVHRLNDNIQAPYLLGIDDSGRVVKVDKASLITRVQGNTDYIKNQTAVQSNSNFNITGMGAMGTWRIGTQIGSLPTTINYSAANSVLMGMRNTDATGYEGFSWYDSDNNNVVDIVFANNTTSNILKNNFYIRTKTIDTSSIYLAPAFSTLPGDFYPTAKFNRDSTDFRFQGVSALKLYRGTGGVKINRRTFLNKDSIPLVTSITNEHVLLEDSITGQIKRISGSVLTGAAQTYYNQFVNTEAVTVNSTATETTIYGNGEGSATIDGDALITAGTKIVFKGAGTIDTDDGVAGPLIFAFKLGTAVVQITLSSELPLDVVNIPYEYEVEFIPISTGSNVDVIIRSRMLLTNLGTPILKMGNTRLPGALTTTGSVVCDVTVDWDSDAVNATNKVQSNYNTIEIFKK